MSIPVAVERLISDAELAGCKEEWGYTILKVSGVWFATFYASSSAGKKYGICEQRMVEFSTANEAFEWCNSHRKAIESLLPQEAV